MGDEKNHKKITFERKKNQKKIKFELNKITKKITFDIRIWEQKNQKTIDIKTDDIARYLSPTIENSKYSSIDD